MPNIVSHSIAGLAALLLTVTTISSIVTVPTAQALSFAPTLA